MKKNEPVRGKIKIGWYEAGREFDILGEPVMCGQLWTPIRYDGDEDPDWLKTAAVEIILSVKE